MAAQAHASEEHPEKKAPEQKHAKKGNHHHGHPVPFFAKAIIFILLGIVILLLLKDCHPHTDYNPVNGRATTAVASAPATADNVAPVAPTRPQLPPSGSVHVPALNLNNIRSEPVPIPRLTYEGEGVKLCPDLDPVKDGFERFYHDNRYPDYTETDHWIPMQPFGNVSANAMAFMSADQNEFDLPYHYAWTDEHC
ncbi:MAG: hypothetical protein ACM3TU_03840 [Bacillota bacterium]